MNRNSNTITTAILHDGREVIISHRNSIGGWANAIARRGIAIGDIASVVAGLPESARVAS
jgi:hypothetical protein